MARRKHHFPVAHDFNEDPEIWRLRQKCGDRAGYVWLEVLSILDRNMNRWEWSKEGWEAVFRKCRVSAANGWRIVGEVVANRWLRVHEPAANDPRTFAGSPNYWKYHSKECQESDFRWTDKGFSEPNHTKPIRNSSDKNPQSSPSVDFKTVDKSEKKKREERHMASMNLSPELKEQTDRLYYSDPVKFKRLAAWVSQGRKYKHSESDMAEALRQFWDYRVIDDWYPYLDTVLEKVEAKRAARESEEESERFKQELRDSGKVIDLTRVVKSV